MPEKNSCSKKNPFYLEMIAQEVSFEQCFEKVMKHKVNKVAQCVALSRGDSQKMEHLLLKRN